MKFKLSINKNLINKGDPRLNGWVNAEFNDHELKLHIEQGYAFCGGVLKDGVGTKKPTSSDILCAQLISIDIDNETKIYNKDSKSYDSNIKSIEDGYLPYDIALSDPWHHDNALLIYKTPSHTEEHHRFRIVFLLPEPIYDPIEYSKIAEVFIEKYGSDKSCKNIDRLFFGNQGADVFVFGKQLSMKELIRSSNIPEAIKKEEYKYEKTGYNGNLTEDQVAEMLSYIPRRMDYLEWGKIVSAVGNYFDETTAVRLIENWSPDENNGTLYKIKHRSKRPQIGSVIFYAGLYGYDKSKLYGSKNGDYNLSKVNIDVNGKIHNKNELQPKKFPLTELGNSERFINDYGYKIKHNFTTGKWHLWNGKLWEEDNLGYVVEMGKNTVRQIYSEIEYAGHENEKKEIFKHALKSECSAQINSMIKLASTRKGIAVKHTDFDNNLFLINLENGTYNLKSNLFSPHDPALMLSKIMTVKYDEEATCYMFEDALLTYFNNDKDMISFIQRALGLTLCGAHLEEILFFCYGTGKNGKSVFFQIMKMIFGDYFQKAPTEMLMLKNQEGIPNDIARLPGARMVVAEELPEGRSLNENKVKNLTGGDVISARFLHKEFFDFEPTHTLWIFGNHKPNIKGTDEGIWRRIKLIPFLVTIPEEERRPHHELMADFELEKSGILNWILDGWKDYQIKGLNPPEVVKKATSDYRDEQDVLIDFIAEYCELSSINTIIASELLQKYHEWCKKMGESPLTKNKFYSRIGQIDGVKSYNGNRNQKCFKGIDLNQNFKTEQRAF